MFRYKVLWKVCYIEGVGCERKPLMAEMERLPSSTTTSDGSDNNKEYLCLVTHKFQLPTVPILLISTIGIHKEMLKNPEKR